jgi:hypothetical protein
MRETVRQDALEKLGESGEADNVRTRHRDYFEAMAAAIGAATSDHERRMEQAEEGIDNLRSAFAWSLENSEIELALGLASSLRSLWLTRGRRHGQVDSVYSLSSALSLHDALSFCTRALAERTILDAALGGVGGMDQAQQALGMARDLDDHGLLVRALMACGYVASHDVIAARPYFAEALGLARALDDRWALSHILVYQAYVAYIAGEPVTARAASEEALQLADSIGDRHPPPPRRCTLAGTDAQGDPLGQPDINSRGEGRRRGGPYDAVRWLHAPVHGGLHPRLFR